MGSRSASVSPSGSSTSPGCQEDAESDEQRAEDGVVELATEAAVARVSSFCVVGSERLLMWRRGSAGHAELPMGTRVEVSLAHTYWHVRRSFDGGRSGSRRLRRPRSAIVVPTGN
jgi:hypothetical protein